MAEDRCKGCQSFCMRGAQVVGLAPGKSTDDKYSSSNENAQTYPDSWKKWSNINRNDTIGAGGNDTSTGPGKLTAESQKDLANFIIAGYAEGTINLNNISEKLKTEEATKQLKRVNRQENSKNPSYFFKNADYNLAITDPDSGGPVGTNSIIYAKHYNAFLKSLFNNTGVVTSDGNKNEDKAKSVSQKDLDGDIIDVGSQLGIAAPSNAYVSVQGDAQAGQGKGTLITAEAYQKLAEQAKKLLYHPYQCNICNIYEGNEWLEIVKETFDAIKSKKPNYYPETTSINIDVNGMTFTMRPDCSGAVAACLYAYDPQNIPSSAPKEWSTHYMDPSGTYGSYIKKAGFEWHEGNNPPNGWEAGDIQLKTQKHTQIVSEEGNAYSGGSTEGLGGARSSISNYIYDGCWRPPAAAGGFSTNKDTACKKGEIPEDLEHEAGDCKRCVVKEIENDNSGPCTQCIGAQLPSGW